MSEYVRTAPDRFDAHYVLRVLRVVSAAEFKAKYADSALGYVWTVAKPLAWFAVLYVVFGRFFKLTGTFEHYTIYLFVGLVLWTFFVDATALALESFVIRSAVLRKLAIPRAVLPLSAAITTALTLVVNCVALAVFVAIERLSPDVRWLLLPLPVIEIMILTFAMSVFLATVFVHARDAGPLWELVVQLMFFASPIIYPVGFLPDWAQKIVFINPFVQALQDARWLLVPEPEIQTAADVYGTPLGYAIPLSALVALLVITRVVYRREAPYLAERA